MVTEYVEYVKSLGKSEGPGIDVRAMKTRQTNGITARQRYIAGVAIIDTLNGNKIHLREAYEAEFYSKAPINPSRILDPSVHNIVLKSQSSVELKNPTLVSITQAEYKKIADKCKK